MNRSSGKRACGNRKKKVYTVHPEIKGKSMHNPSGKR
jgi:hypothetical protein